MRDATLAHRGDLKSAKTISSETELVMIRVYFVFEDPLDDAGINLSYADVPTADPGKAFKSVHAAESGDLWKLLYPDGEEHPYTLIRSKITYLDISGLLGESKSDTALRI